MGHGRENGPRYLGVHGGVRRHRPIILDERPEQFPSATGGCTIEGPIVDRTSHLADHQICRSIAGKLAKIDKESILEGIRIDVHLLSADATAHSDVVLAPNDIE